MDRSATPGSASETPADPTWLRRSEGFAEDLLPGASTPAVQPHRPVRAAPWLRLGRLPSPRPLGWSAAA